MMVDRHGAPILLVEDSPEDFETTRRAFRRAGLRNPMLHCTTGDDALDFLHHRGRYTPATAPRPGIILLAEIKGEHSLADIPVVVLTTSADHRDVEACYQAGANSYVQKPVNLDAFMDAIQRLHDYWFDVVILPNES